jgi:hypothetical protein
MGVGSKRVNENNGKQGKDQSKVNPQQRYIENPYEYQLRY